MKSAALLLAGLALAGRPVSADGPSLKGYVKSFPMVQMPAAISGLPSPVTAWNIGTAVRLKLTYLPKDNISLNLAYSLSPRLQNPASAVSAPGPGDPRRYRMADPDPRLLPPRDDPPENLSLYHNLDRAYVRASVSWADLYLGRQPVSWGTARVFNPTDIIAPFSFGELDTEDRIGVDAARLVVPLGELSEVNAGYVAGRRGKWANSAVFLRGKTSILNTDVSLVTAKFRDNLLGGFDLARSIGGAGFWLESSLIRYDLENAAGYGSWRTVARAASGADYRFSQKFYLWGEFLLSQAGETRPGDYPLNALKPAFREGTDYFQGRAYLTLGLTYEVTPLFNSNTQPIINLNDRSTMLKQQLEYNLTEDTYLSLGAFWGIGPRNELDPAGFIKVNSEFGSYPSSYFSSLRWYF